MSMQDPDRIAAVEENAAHAQAALDDVSKEMAQQWAAIRALEKKLDLVLQHLRDMRAEEDQMDASPQPPPHY